MTHAQKIGQYLAAIRKGRKLSQRTVATWAGVSSSFISGAEADASTVHFDTIVAWARALNVDLASLIQKLDRGIDLMPLPATLKYHGRTYVRSDLPFHTIPNSPAKRVDSSEVTHETP